MKRRNLVGLPMALGAFGASLAQTALGWPTCTVRHSGLGRGFHVGEATGRTLDDFRAMASVGASLVRFGIALVPDDAGSRFIAAPAAMAELNAQLGFARQTGMRLVITLRPPPEPDSPLWSNPVLQQRLEDLWQLLAMQLIGHAEVAAFDLVNEAHPPGLTFALKQQRWNSLAERLIQAVRAVDPTRRLVLEPSPGARPMAFATATKLPFDNIAYSVHMYEPFEFSHQRIGDAKLIVDYPGQVPDQGWWGIDRVRNALMPAKTFADRHGVEMYVGEFGAVRWAPGESRVRYLRDLLTLFAEWNWSWTYHGWREWHGWDAEMGGDAGRMERRDSEPAFRALRQALNSCESAGGKR